SVQMTVHCAGGSLAKGAPTATYRFLENIMRFLLNVLLVTASLIAMPLVKSAQLLAAQQPAAQQPVAQEPAAQQPEAQPPAVQPRAAQQPTTESQVVDKIVTREQEEMRLIRQFSPLVETY